MSEWRDSLKFEVSQGRHFVLLAPYFSGYRDLASEVLSFLKQQFPDQECGCIDIEEQNALEQLQRKVAENSGKRIVVIEGFEEVSIDRAQECADVIRRYALEESDETRGSSILVLIGGMTMLDLAAMSPFDTSPLEIGKRRFLTAERPLSHSPLGHRSVPIEVDMEICDDTGIRREYLLRDSSSPADFRENIERQCRALLCRSSEVLTAVLGFLGVLDSEKVEQDRVGSQHLRLSGLFRGDGFLVPFSFRSAYMESLARRALLSESVGRAIQAHPGRENLERLLTKVVVEREQGNHRWGGYDPQRALESFRSLIDSLTSGLISMREVHLATRVYLSCYGIKSFMEFKRVADSFLVRSCVGSVGSGERTWHKVENVDSDLSGSLEALRVHLDGRQRSSYSDHEKLLIITLGDGITSRYLLAKPEGDFDKSDAAVTALFQYIEGLTARYRELGPAGVSHSDFRENDLPSIFVAHKWQEEDNVDLITVLESLRDEDKIVRSVDAAILTPGNRIWSRLSEGINQADWLIAEVSSLSPNVGMELGFAIQRGKKVILIHRPHHKVPEIVRQYGVIEYDSLKDLKTRLGKLLALNHPVTPIASQGIWKDSWVVLDHDRCADLKDFRAGCREFAKKRNHSIVFANDPTVHSKLGRNVPMMDVLASELGSCRGVIARVEQIDGSLDSFACGMLTGVSLGRENLVAKVYRRRYGNRTWKACSNLRGLSQVVSFGSLAELNSKIENLVEE